MGRSLILAAAVGLIVLVIFGLGIARLSDRLDPSSAADTATVEDAVEKIRLPSGLTVGDYLRHSHYPRYQEALTWVNEQWMTCSASRVVISVEKCMSDDAIQTCGSWLGSIDPEWPEYTDCVADMQYLAKEMLTGKYVDEGYCCSTPGPADEDCWVEEEGKLHTC